MGQSPSEGEGEEGESESSPQPTSQMDESGGTQGDLPELEVPNEPEVQTADALQDNIQSLVNQQGEDNVYVEIPTINVDKIVVSNAEVHQVIDASWKDHLAEVDALRQGIGLRSYGAKNPKLELFSLTYE